MENTYIQEVMYFLCLWDSLMNWTIHEKGLLAFEKVDYVHGKEPKLAIDHILAYDLGLRTGWVANCNKLCQNSNALLSHEWHTELWEVHGCSFSSLLLHTKGRGLESQPCQWLSLTGSRGCGIIGSPLRGRGEDSAGDSSPHFSAPQVPGIAVHRREDTVKKMHKENTMSTVCQLGRNMKSLKSMHCQGFRQANNIKWNTMITKLRAMNFKKYFQLGKKKSGHFQWSF